jgi:hypothetical protein
MDEARTAPLHLLSVWNPSYADDAMDRHLEVLLRWAAARREERAEDEDVYVWWAKLRSRTVRSRSRIERTCWPSRDQIDSGVETHLYLTDYGSLYVAHLVEVTGDSVPRDWPDERDHMPPTTRDTRRTSGFACGTSAAWSRRTRPRPSRS